VTPGLRFTPKTSGGSGSYGDACSVITGELAAIKVIKLEPGEDFTVVQQEIVMMEDCKHVNNVAYLGSYLRSGVSFRRCTCHQNKLWICMEYCGGGSLQDVYHGKIKNIKLKDMFRCGVLCCSVSQWQLLML
uniref:Protein kinase domain-containing protein n=1 Tax=Denticeps clupeoides TaxID=299321 RepID=A0AAY4A021_9TELE